jgi:hypothetical protein
MSAYLLVMLLAVPQFTQTNAGELRVVVTDAVGAPVESAIDLVSEANDVHETGVTDAHGTYIVRRLPFGSYRLTVTRSGFAPSSSLVSVRSALPQDVRVTLVPAPIHTQITVKAGETLIDARQTSTVQRIGADSLAQRTTALPGRSLPDLVNTQPGWLLEANGILHPRGSEYQTQFVVDGLPLTDNRSPAFAPEIGADDVHALSILTGGYPAEYGRKLGGVIEVVTASSARRGLHGSVSASGGSFATFGSDAQAEYGWERATLSARAGAATTDRYLDPPVEENDTNHGTTANASVRFERDLAHADRVGAIVRVGTTDFLVPNELIQQAAGQRQARGSRETMGQFSYQRVFSSRLLADVRGMARRLAADLSSNDASTPIAAAQDRGFRELYVKASLAGDRGVHEWKIGVDTNTARVRERFSYRITDPSFFPADTAPAFAFHAARPDREQALFAQDQVRLADLTLSAGLRWDHYRLVVDQNAFSPRLAAAWSWPRANLVVRASYDRVFQTPAFENLLLASSSLTDALGADVARLPVPPSRGNFFDVGVSRTLFATVRIDANYFVRAVDNFADDDLLLNTGVSFPIAFRSADIKGAELKVSVPRWKRLSGFAGYAYMKGTGTLPVTGALFLDEDVSEMLAAAGTFALSQDQRHTFRGRFSVTLAAGSWIAVETAYGSGLPFEFDGDRDEALDEYGPRIVNRVDFETGRVRPSWSLDASAGVRLVKWGSGGLQAQADVRNLTNRFDVINFAGLFSGTAVAPPRAFALRVRADF